MKKWTYIFAVIGLVIGLLHPHNLSFGVDMPSAVAFALPWVFVFGLIGVVIDFVTRRKS